MPILKTNSVFLPENCMMLEDGFVIEMSEMELLESRIDSFLSMDNYEDDEYLNEGFIDNVKDSFGDIITLITKGKDVVRKRHHEAAQKADEYQKEINTIVQGDKKIKGEMLTLEEYYIDIVQVGNTTVITEYRRNPEFYGPVINFDKLKSELLKISNMEDKKTKRRSKSRLMKKYSEIYYGAIKYNPIIVEKKAKLTVDQHIKNMQLNIAYAKKRSEEFDKAISQAIKEVEKGRAILESMKSNPPSSNDLSLLMSNFKKAIKYQVGMYKHDLRLVDKYNVMIVRQSRALAEAIKKYSKSK